MDVPHVTFCFDLRLLATLVRFGPGNRYTVYKLNKYTICAGHTYIVNHFLYIEISQKYVIVYSFGHCILWAKHNSILYFSRQHLEKGYST